MQIADSMIELQNKTVAEQRGNGAFCIYLVVKFSLLHQDLCIAYIGYHYNVYKSVFHISNLTINGNVIVVNCT